MCYSSYSNCVAGTDPSADCQVRYNQLDFQVASPFPCSSDKYLFSGAAAIQLCVDTEITKLHTNNPSIQMPLVSTQMMPLQLQFVEPLNTGINFSLLFYMIGTGGFTTIFVVWLVTIEKEKKLKQLLHMIGVSPTAYWLGWFLGSLAVWLIVGFILWLMLYLGHGSKLSSTDGWMLALIIFMAGVNAIVMGFLFVSLFNRAVLAVMFVIVYVFAIGLIFIIISTVGAQSSSCFNGTYWVSIV